MRKLALLLTQLACCTLSARVHVANVLDAVEFAPNAGVQEFVRAVTPNAGKLIGDLLNGISQAGYLESSTWASPTLTATLNQPHLYGEIASQTRIPVYWSLDKELTFTVSEESVAGTPVATVAMTGVHSEPCAQGIGLYEDFMDEAGLQRTQNNTDAISLKEETSAALAYLEAHFWDNKNGRRSMKKQDGKISKILLTSYDTRKFRWTVGKEFATIFYEMSTVVPSTMRSFQFFESNGQGRVLANTEEWIKPEGNDDRYRQYNFRKKSEGMGAQSMLNAKNTMRIAEMLLPHDVGLCLNYARMMAYGNSAERPSMESAGIEAGSPDAIANLLSFCEGSTPGTDPQCTGGTPGRVAWTPNPGDTMTANPSQV